ncbi:hypothetical protein [Clostridiisalibacter paucivorans]|uniref:hypothetical protein n=1 Tax=Clostridiisalibacter paucivorans TaxID=408753 RepID=UPI00146FAE68|nr:hypothetical protein [Clostridiisalibacter paucivorans]
MMKQMILFDENSENQFKKICVELEKKDLRPHYKPKHKLSTEKSKLVIQKMINEVDITYKPTNEVYKMYKDVCEKMKIGFMTQIGFSKYITNHYDFMIVDKKSKGIKFRIFVKSSK